MLRNVDWMIKIEILRGAEGPEVELSVCVDVWVRRVSVSS